MPSHSCIADKSYPRLDRYISEVLLLLSRSQIKARKLKANINGKEVKLSRNVENGDELNLTWEEEPPDFLLPQDLPLEIIYEDDRQIVVNKAQGMVVHPGAGNRQGTLANAILYRIINNLSFAHCCLPPAACRLRPGIVHRLDKDTSGVIIAAYDEEAHAFLAGQFKSRRVRKTYIAIVHGKPKEAKGRIETFIARDPKDRKKFTVSDRGRNAVTFFKVIKTMGGYSKANEYSLILLRPRTGRTHQLRVHMRHIGCPILGDSFYGGRDKNFADAALMLHAKKLEITLIGEDHPTIFSTPVPKRFKDIIEKISYRGHDDTELTKEILL